MKSIMNIDKSQLCIGCGICQSIAGKDNITLELKSDGFFHPKKCNEHEKYLNVIRKICPGLRVTLKTKSSSSFENVWGPSLNVFSGYANDKKIRWLASSGGGLSALLTYFLDKKIVSGIIQVKKNPDNPLSNKTVISKKSSDIINCAGSRYSPSTPLIDIKNQLSESVNKIAFVGRPCDIAALRAYLDIYSQEKQKVFILTSFFCAGTPSYNATDDLLEKMGASKQDIKEFWYRGRGWPGKSTAIDKNNNHFTMEYQQSWGEILNAKLHFRCKICADGIGSLADISFADGWDLKDGHPCFDEKEGKNLIFSRTALGDSVLKDAIENNYIKVEKIDVNTIKLIQPSQYLKKRVVGARILALRLTGLTYPKYKGFNLIYNSLHVNPIVFLRNLLGLLYRRLKQLRNTLEDKI